MTKPSFIRWSKWTSHVTLISSSHRHGIIAFQDNGHSFDAVLLYGHEFSLTIFEVKQTSFCESVYLVSCYHKTEFSSPATRVLAYILLIDKVSLYDCCFRWAFVLLCNCCCSGQDFALYCKLAWTKSRYPWLTQSRGLVRNLKLRVQICLLILRNCGSKS